MRKTGKIWTVLKEGNDEHPFFRYICEDGDGKLWQFYISRDTHEEIEQDLGKVEGRIVQWNFRKKTLRFFR